MQVTKYIPPVDDPRDEGTPPLLSVMLFASGQYLMAAASRDLFVWDVKTRECVYREELADPYLSHELLFPLTPGPDRTFATSWGKDFALWSLDTFKPLRVFEGHQYYVYHAMFLDERHVVSCSGDSTLRRWSIASGECLQKETVYVPERMADSAETGRIAIAGTRGIELVARDTLRHVVLHSLPFEETPYNAITPSYQRGTGAQALAWCPGHAHLLAACADFIVRRIDAVSGQVVGKWLGHTGSINDVAVLPGGCGFVSVGDDGGVLFFRMDRSECIVSVRLEDRALGLCVSPQGEVYVSCSDGFVYAMHAPRELVP